MRLTTNIGQFSDKSLSELSKICDILTRQKLPSFGYYLTAVDSETDRVYVEDIRNGLLYGVEGDNIVEVDNLRLFNM